MRSPARPGCWGWAAPEAYVDAFETNTISCPYQDSNPGSSSPTQYQGRQLFHATPAVVEYEKGVTYTVSDSELLTFRGNLLRISAVSSAILTVSWSSPSIPPCTFPESPSVISRPLPSTSFSIHSRMTLHERCKNSGRQIARVTDPNPEACNFYGSSVRNMLHLAFLVPSILRWFLDFWKICASLLYNSASYSPSYRQPRKITRKCDSLPLHFITDTKGKTTHRHSLRIGFGTNVTNAVTLVYVKNLLFASLIKN